MDEQALNDAYSLFTRQGYNGTIDQFKKLISTNKDALNDSYQIFRAQGYNGDINNYSTLVGVKKKVSSSASTPDSEVGMEDLQNGFDFSPTIFEAPAVLTPKKQKEYIAEQKGKPAPTPAELPETSATPKGWETYQAPSKEGEQGTGLNILSSLNRSIYKNLIGNPIKGLGTLIEGATSLLPRQIRSETGKGIISESLIDFGNYFNNAIDEISPQDKAFKDSLTDQFAQAFGQVASTIMTAGIGTAASKGLSLASKAPSMLAKPLSARGAALAAAKEAGEQIIGPVGISSALTMGQSEYERAKQAGASDEQAFEAFYKNAVTGSVLETIPVMQFMKRFNNATKGGVLNYIKTKGVAGLTGGVEELTTEVLQTVYSNKTAQEIYNENQDLFEGVGTAGGIGFGVGFLLNAMGANAKILRKEGKTDEADALDNQINDIQSRIESGPPAVYKINGLKIESPQIVSDMIERMDAPDLSKLNIEIDNDPVLKTKLQDKIVTSSIMAQVREANPELNEPSLKAITELEKQLTLLEGNKTQTGKDKAADIRTQIKNIQENQLQEEAVAETITAEAPELAQQRVDRIAEIEELLTPDAYFMPIEKREELQTELETLKTEQDAIQEQAAGQVPVQSETGVSQEVPGGEPKTEPQVLTEEVVQEEVKAPEITRESIRSLTDEEINPLYDEIPLRLLPTVEGVSKQDAVFEAYFKSKKKNTNPGLVQAVEKVIIPAVSLKTQPVQEVAVAPEVIAPEVVVEEQFAPLTKDDIEFDIKFSKDNASSIEQEEGSNGRLYTSEIETAVSDADGTEIGYLVKMVDDDKNLTFEARDENGSNLSKNDEGFPTLGEARQALLDNLNKAKKKEFTKEAKAKAKAKEKEVAKKAKAKAKAETKKPAKVEPSTETEEEQVARMMELFEKGTVATTDSGISVTNKSQIDNIKGKITDKLKLKVIESAQKALKTLKSVLPNFDIIIHDNEGSYNSAMIARGGVAGSSGNFSINNKGSYSGRIDINLERANARTVAHEVAHGIMLKAFGDTPALFKKFRDRISTVLKESTNETLIDFAAQYEGDVTYEEYLAELTAILEQQEENISPSILQKIAAIINAVVSKITNGTLKPFENIKDTKEIMEFFSGVAKSIREGEDVKEKEPSISKKEKEIAAKIAIVEGFENKAADKVKKLSDLLGFNLGKPVSKSQASNAPLPVNTQVANGFDILKKKFGETAAKSIRENIPFALDYPNEFAEFITKKIPVKEDIAFIVKNISQRLDGLFRLESDKNIETVKVVNKTPEELSKEAGYVFHRPESENDILAFKKDFENGEVLCTYNDVEGRMQGHFIFWLRRNDAESVLPAKQITQEYLKDDSEGSILWRAYLDGKGLKMPDGSYDLSNLNASRQDPYGTSSMSVQIGRRGGNISIKNRYNHTVNNPDATFGNDLNTIIDGLDNAVFGIEGIPKKASQELRLPDNITSDLKGRFFKYDQEIENIYFSQHGYVDEGEIILIDKSHQRMVDNFIFDSKTNEVIPVTLSRQLIRDINNVTFEKNKIIVNSDNGDYEFEFLNGTLNKLSSDITTIGDSFLQTNTTLESISLPNVTKIGDTFLSNNKNLKSISLPSVTDIGNGFLRRNITLESISLPNVKAIGTDFLIYNEDLKSISLPNVETIGDGFLKFNTTLNSISLPRVKIINNEFLKNNLDLKSISLPNLDEIGDYFLNENYNLTSVELPNVTQIGFGFLRNNISLRNISLPNVTRIGEYFLNRNTNLRSISLPNVIRVGGSFLENNTVLESISLPNVQFIGDYFLARNQVISNVELPSVLNIDHNFLRSNYSLKGISLPNVIKIGASFLKNNEKLNKISLPNVEDIGEDFLNTNEGLESISLPNVKDIGKYFMINNSSVERPVISKSQKNNVNEINTTVNDFRAQGFSESAIKTFLIQQGYSATEANQILNISPIQGEFDSLMNKVDKLIARQKSRGIEDGKITSNIDIYIRKQDEYLNANDAQKKIIEREARAKMGAAPKRAVSIGRVLGALKDITNISRAEKMLVIKQIRDLSRDAVKELAKELRLMASSGKITPLQSANIVAKFGKVNMLSEMSVSKFVDYMAKIFANSEYAFKLKVANGLRGDIKELSRNKEKNPSLRDLAQKFSNIKPSMVEDIDAYNEMASKIKEAIKGSTIRGQKVKFAETVNIENATEYINKTIDAQDEKINKEKADEIQDLMGVDVSDLSYDEMMMLLDSKEPITKYNEGIIRSAINKAFGIYSSIIKNSINTGKDPFTDENVSFTKNQKRIVTEFMNMNLNKLEPKEALRALDALVNFLQNRSIAKMDTVVAEYKALINSEKLVEEGVKARLLKKYGSTMIGKFFAEQTTTLPVLFEKMFPGLSRSRYVMRMMGLTNLINESSAAKTEARNIVNDYVKEFYKRKANGQEFNTVENNVERGMAAILIRTVIGTEAQMQKEFNRKKEILKESIAMLSEGNEKEVAKSILYQEAYDKLVGSTKSVNENQTTNDEATNIQQVKDRLDKTNLEAVEFWIKNYSDRYERFSEVSEGVYNTILEKELNYTPVKFSLLSLESESIELGDEESAFQKNSGQLYDKKSGTLNKVTQPGAEEIRTANRYLNLSFDQNMANLMQDALIDVNTAAPIKQVKAFLNSPNFRKIFPNEDDALIVKGNKKIVGRVSLYVNSLRNKNNFTSDELSSAMRKLDKAAALGVSLALGTVSQIPKQTLSVSINTLINSGRLPDYSALTNIDKINFINNSGRDIANRGIGSQAEIESINKLIEKAASSKGEKAIKLIEEANTRWINLLLVKPDVAIARASWLTYYEQSLRKQGIDTKGLDYKTHEINNEAADYASAQVGRQQNISDHDLSGKLFLNEQALAKWFVKTMMAFSSFRMNAASRLGADLTTLNDETSTKDDKLTAARSIAGFGAELASFKLVSIILTVAWGSLTKLISGEEEEEDEFNKRKRLAIKAHRSSVPADIFSPLPIIDPFFQKLVAAPALNKIEEVTGLPVSIYATPNNKSIFAELGSLGIAGDRILRIIELGKLAATGKYTDDYGNEQTIPEKKRESLIRFVPLSILASVGVIPQEGNTLAMNAMKYAKSKSSYNDSLTRRALDRWSSSVDLEEYPQVAEFIENKRKELAGEGDQAQQREELNKLKKSLLEGYDDKNQMNAVEPELYRKNFGENSDWVKKGYDKKDAMESKYNSALSKKEKMIEIEDLKAENEKIK